MWEAKLQGRSPLFREYLLQRPQGRGERLCRDYSQFLRQPGLVYGANLIDAYTGPDGEGAVELVWNVSTWNPYGVLFLRTRVAP